MDNLFTTFIISIISASAFVFLNKFYTKLPQAFSFVRKFTSDFIKYIVSLFKFNNVLSDRLNESFDQNMQVLYSFLGSDDFKYKLPFILVIGAEKSGKSSLISSLKLEKSIDDLVEKNDFCNWSFFNDAVLLEMHSALFSSGTSFVSSDAHNWHKLLNLLAYHRPERPIDSLVLTISMRDLLDESMNLANLAEHYYVKLWNMQKSFGSNFPIYIVITHTDLVPGFSHFCSALRMDLKEEIFGWSNPNTLNEFEDTNFVEDAMNSIVDRLLLIQQEILVHQVSHANKYGIFAFPFELYKIKGKLKEILGYIFKKNAVHDQFMLRGFYFTGAGSNNAYAKHEFSQALKSVEFGEITQTPSLNIANDIFFSTDLFVSKIFKEKGLSRPLSNNMFDNEKKVRILQYLTIILALSGVGSFVHYYNNIQKVRVNLKHNISNVRLALNNIKLIYSSEYDEFDNIIFEEQSAVLINAMSKIYPNDLFFYSMPPSWFSPIRYKLNFMLGNAYAVVIFKFIINKFNHDLQKLVSGKMKFRINKVSHYHNPLQSKEFLELFAYVENITKMENIYHKIQRMPYLRNLNDVIYVMKNLMNIDMKKSFHRNQSVFQNALQYVEFGAINIDKYKQDIRNQVDSLFDKFIENAFEYYNVIPNVTNIENMLQAILSKKDANVDKLNFNLNQFIDVLNNQGLKWITIDKFNLGEQFSKMLLDVQDSYILGQKMAKDMKIDVENKIIDLNEKVTNHKIPLMGKVFKKSKNGSVEVSKEFTEFQGMLNLLSGQEFMNQRSYTNRNLKPALLSWNVDNLLQASKLIDDFTKFAHHKMLYKNEKTTNSMNIVASRSIISNIRHLLTSGQKAFDSFDSEEVFVSNAAQNLKQSYKHLLKILMFVKDKDHNLFVELKAVLYKQSVLLLEKVNRALEEKHLYNVSRASFYTDQIGSINKNDVKIYLRKQHAQLDHLANLAKPAVMILEKLSGMGKKIYIPTFLIWKDIITNVDNDKEGKENSIKSLEKFIENYFANKNSKCITASEQSCVIGNNIAQECLAMGIKFDSETSSYFLQRKKELILSIRNRCILDQYAKAKSQYRKITSYFNQHMKHKYPFNKQSNVEIDANTAKEFVSIWKEKAFDITMLSQYIYDEKQHDWIKFLEKMNTVIPWLESMYEPNKQGAFLIKLRTNHMNENFANHLAVWDMKLGNKSVSMNMPATEMPFSTHDFANIIRISRESKLRFNNHGKKHEILYQGYFGIIKFINQFCMKNNKNIKEIKLDIPVYDCFGQKHLILWIDIALKGNLHAWPDFPSHAPALGGFKLCTK